VDLDTSQVRLLAELGLIAVGESRIPEAEAIARALEAARPGSEAVYVMRALLEMRRPDPEAAVKLLREEGLSQHPESPVLEALLGMALTAAGYVSQAEPVLRRVSEQDRDEKAAALAASFLTPVDRARPEVGGV